MRIRTKKQNADGIVRLETSGELKEIIIKEDLLNPSWANVHICFRGKDSSGIVEMTPKEIEALYRQIHKNDFSKNIQVMKFRK